MTRIEHLLAILGEEAVEISQRTTKALRFGDSEIQEGQNFDNAERIAHESADFRAVYEMLIAEGVLPEIDRDRVESKKSKVEKFLAYNHALGKLELNAENV